MSAPAGRIAAGARAFPCGFGQCASSWLPPAVWLGSWAYIGLTDHWGAFAAAPLLMASMSLSLALGVMGGFLFSLKAWRGELDPLPAACSLLPAPCLQVRSFFLLYRSPTMHSSVQFGSAFLDAGWRCLARWVTSTCKRELSFALLLLLAACNAPPMYNTRAQEYLQKQGVSNDLIIRLVEGRRLSESEAAMLEEFGNTTLLHLFPGNPVTAVLHLLASNPSIPASMIARLAANRDEEVRWGIAYNPSAPVEVLLAFRTPGEYTTMNEYLARNPRIPSKVLLEMYRNKEANRVGFAQNPNCPAALMREIAEQGTDLDRTWLAANPNLPSDLVARLARDPSENVQRFLAQNRAFKDWKAAGGGSTTGAPR